ncbi:helicase associated domain-containing protein [Streptomyces sp900116325]|uniref:helicase associated domain-containing protein n=1 Tax=Streptomyces sp. 900116325 TaxID=3154295 RepID=UPI00339E9AB6
MAVAGWDYGGLLERTVVRRAAPLFADGTLRATAVRNPVPFPELIPLALRIRCKPNRISAIAATLAVQSWTSHVLLRAFPAAFDWSGGLLTETELAGLRLDMPAASTRLALQPVDHQLITALIEDGRAATVRGIRRPQRDLRRVSQEQDRHLPGVTHRGDDIGRWLARQVRDWAQLNPEQQHRLDEVGVKPAALPQKTAARTNTKAGTGKGSDAFTRGVAALRQYIQREKKTVVGQQHVEELPAGTTVKLGVFLSNHKNRRHRFTEQLLTTLAALGLD